MDTYKVIRIRTTRYGDSEWAFVASTGKAYSFPIVGRVWKWSDCNERWDATDAVVESKASGLLRVKSRSAAPLKVAAGEVYLPIAVTGRNLGLRELPVTA